MSQSIGLVVPQLEDWVSVVVDVDLPAQACRAEGHQVAHGEWWVVEGGDGVFVGRVTLFAPPVLRAPRGSGARLLRPATDQDLERAAELADQEREIEAYLRRRTGELAIDLRPLKVLLPLVGRKAVVYFTAEQRVDFRPLLTELGRRFRRRVEMRPLGVRDGARLAGGLGPCGRTLCCATFMERFHSVTVRMAKRQNLSLNPTKISGLCGRLMCCLAYEVDQYPLPVRERPSPAE
jgi:cell fate regulator YaaT (PSP1 superfamily)